MSDFHGWTKSIAPLAARQWGHVRREQLLALGVAAGTIDWWVNTRRLVPAHAGVYAVAYRRIDPHARAAAAVLAGHPDAVLSHESAAALWDLRRWPDVPEITSPRCIRRTGIDAHRSHALSGREITTQWGIRTVTAFCAIRQIWPRLTVTQRTRLPNDALLRHLISIDEAQILRGHRRNPTRSGGEDRLRSLVETYDLPDYETNVMVCGREAA